MCTTRASSHHINNLAMASSRRRPQIVIVPFYFYPSLLMHCNSAHAGIMVVPIPDHHTRVLCISLGRCFFHVHCVINSLSRLRGILIESVLVWSRSERLCLYTSELMGYSLTGCIMFPFVLLGLLFLSGAYAEGPVPQKITLTSRVAPKGSSLKGRALSPVNVPLADFFKGTDLQYVITWIKFNRSLINLQMVWKSFW